MEIIPLLGSLEIMKYTITFPKHKIKYMNFLFHLNML